jgi:hypothetical protein
MEETTPRRSGAWKPTTTFAAQMGRVREAEGPGPGAGAGARDEKREGLGAV